MTRSTSAMLDRRHTRLAFSTFVWRQILSLAGLSILALLVLALVALATWNIADPSYSNGTANEPTNAMGYAGAAFADIAMQFFGLASVIALLPVLALGIALIFNRNINRIIQRTGAWLGGSILASAVLSCTPAPVTWPIPNGVGGVFGDMILKFPALFVGSYPTGMTALIIGSIIAMPAFWLLAFSCGLIVRHPPEVIEQPQGKPVTLGKVQPLPKVEVEEDEDGFATHFIGAATHAWYSAQARVRRLVGLPGRKIQDRGFEEPYDFNDDEFGTLNEPVRPKVEPAMAATPRTRTEPSLDAPVPAAASRRVVSAPPIFADDEDDDFDADREPVFDQRDNLPAGLLSDDTDMDDWDVAPVAPKPASASTAPAARISIPEEKPKVAQSIQREARAAFHNKHGFELPAVELLAEPKNVVRDATLSADALEQNARMLEGVLEDFGVKGEIIHVRPGPVVTLYELEPAPGIKSSRVIGLADDIARSMSAIAARVAVVPGRNAIGIELPNQRRETVYLRELIASQDFMNSKAKLAMALGKTIGGESVITDIAKMPHLLVAGTTGSGKSVAINTMILSLLYRMTPEQCRLIMIDPKMLELSVYDGIPHLLSPVVTDPKKAVVALKWTVREMEERYKKMSKIGVRNIDGFNSRVEQAMAKGEAMSRTVQTGFDRHTGEAIYETEEFDLQPIPYIVVIIDEMADLMMVAGKEIEGAVQRLAQMARAAGIHVIMATQRPSVDVITGTIKANFPTRISFQVTSKIDSRTILGEQGAEQLLGMGDMLYMAGGGRIQRVHGPFVSDVEVEEVVAYLKTQGTPQYLDAITADDEEESDGASNGKGPAGTSNLEESDDPYDQAVAVVLRDGKASTSYVQRRLGIGYNRAASLIERMEKEGVISRPNHAGKREILVPTEADIDGR
jgi:DNA segregation ATPase FtsK/SpoIIIE, S-DNA-T family